MNVGRRRPHPSDPICADSMPAGSVPLSRMITSPGTPRRHRDSRRRGKVLSRQRLPRTPATYPCVDGREGLVSIIGAADVGSKRGRPRRGSDYAGLLSRVREAGLLRPRLAYYTMTTVLTTGLLAVGWTVFVLVGATWTWTRLHLAPRQRSQPQPPAGGPLPRGGRRLRDRVAGGLLSPHLPCDEPADRRGTISEKGVSSEVSGIDVPLS
jgi:hypothetical protein